MIVSMVKRPRTPPTNNPALDYQTADSEHVLKRSRPSGIPEEASSTANVFHLLVKWNIFEVYVIVISKLPPTFGVAFLPILLSVSSSYDCLQANNLPVNIMPSIYPGQSHAHSMYSADDLPKTVMANLNQGSSVKSMDFHPVQQTLLLGLITYPTLSRR